MDIPTFVRWMKEKENLDYCIFREKDGKPTVEVVSGAFTFAIPGKSYDDAMSEFVRWSPNISERSEKVLSSDHVEK